MTKNKQSPNRGSPHSMTGNITQLTKEKHANHLERIRNAKSQCDNHGVKINATDFTRLAHLSNHTHTILHNGNKNKHLLIELDKIIMKPIEPCAPLTKDVEVRKRKQRVVRDHFQAIVDANLFLADRIGRIKNPVEPKQSKPSTQQQPISLVPASIIKRFEHIVSLPRSTTLRNKMFRPKVFMELEAKGERTIDRITFQLYTEANPLLVLSLVRFFDSGDCKNIRFPRIYTSLWAETEIALDGDQLHCDKFYDMKALACDGKQNGYLFFALQDFRILKKGTLVFTINFRPILVNDGKRFAFGKLVGGRTQFLCLHEYGTKTGKPLKELRVTNMGVL